MDMLVLVATKGLAEEIGECSSAYPQMHSFSGITQNMQLDGSVGVVLAGLMEVVSKLFGHLGLLDNQKVIPNI